MIDLPESGQIFDYPYLWSWQAARGETEGRKERPSCVALVVPLKSGRHRIYMLPITTKEPTADQVAIEVPRTEIQRAGLSRDISQWVILSEWNREIFETSFYISETDTGHSFSRIFCKKLIAKLGEELKAGRVTTVGRE